LPLCFGEATKFSRFLLDADKAYTSTFILGAETNTGDSEGSIVASSDASHISAADVEQVLPRFRGDIEQVPPMFSALKQDGQPLYKLARAGLEVERKSRPVVISELVLLAFRAGKQAQVDVHIGCSKGTYVRTLAEDIGKALGCGAHVGALRRTRAGPFTEGSAVSLTALEGLKHNDAHTEMDALLLPADAALGNLPMVQLTESGGFYIRQGQPVLVPNSPCSGMVRVGLESGEFLGIGEILDDGRVAPRRLVVSR
jgi:tRNA pseudouridine55 synthase